MKLYKTERQKMKGKLVKGFGDARGTGEGDARLGRKVPPLGRGPTDARFGAGGDRVPDGRSAFSDADMTVGGKIGNPKG